jgi:hypothetical protein
MSQISEKKQEYVLETSSDGKKWELRAVFREGDMSRFGKPFSPEVVVWEAKSFIDNWSPQNRSYNRDVFKEISERKHVRIIIQLS